MNVDYILNEYKFVHLDSIATCDRILEENKSKKFSILAFDTESDTKIDMTRKDGSNIDLVNDKPFLLQFGHDNIIYIGDLTVSPELTRHIVHVFDTFCKNSKLVMAHNIKFDLHMMQNRDYVYKYSNACDLMSVARLALESKTEREGGYPMGLKPLASRLLGSDYAALGQEVDYEMQKIWKDKLKMLHILLEPYGISRAQINETLKDVTGTLEEYPPTVQSVWTNWIVNSRVSYMDIPRNILIKYAGMDVILVLKLADVLLPMVSEKEMIGILRNEMELLMPLVRMERTGFTVDKKYLIKAKQALVFEINNIREMNAKILGVNLFPNQHMEIKKAILNKFGYDLKSTDKNSLHVLVNTDKTMPEPVKDYLNNVVYLRTLEKFISTYINSMLYKLHGKTTKVYTQFNSAGTVSGRFTSNFQQFPKDAVYSKVGKFELFHPRKMFTVESEEYPMMAFIDYSQIELRLQAEYTYRCSNGEGDVNMLRAYLPFKCIERDGNYYLNEDSNKQWSPVDVHTQTTKTAFPDLDFNSSEFKKLRSIGKRLNFAIIYGASLNKLITILADTDPTLVRNLYNSFNATFRDVALYRSWVRHEFTLKGYVENMLGRRYYISDPKDSYKLTNYLIQGSAADILKKVIIELDKYIINNNLKSKLQASIHDEIIFAMHKDEFHEIENFKKIMEDTFKCYVPIVAESSTTTTTWGDKK
jgi:DNA polymerase I